MSQIVIKQLVIVPVMKPTNTEAYLEQLPFGQRKALEQLRKQILSACAGAEEHFGYGLPGFKYNGHPMLYIGAAKNHCALYGSVPVGFKERLKDFTVSKGTIQFTPGKTLPAALVKDIVRAKCVEIEVRWPEEVHKGKATKSRNTAPGMSPGKRGSRAQDREKK